MSWLGECVPDVLQQITMIGNEAVIAVTLLDRGWPGEIDDVVRRIHATDSKLGRGEVFEIEQFDVAGQVRIPDSGK